MAGLQRSSETFRRSGSSGMVWEDKLQQQSGELGGSKSEGAASAARAAQRSGSSGHGGYKAGHVQPALDPPSPRVAACGFCNLFGKDDDKQQARSRGGGGGGKNRRR